MIPIRKIIPDLLVLSAIGGYGVQAGNTGAGLFWVLALFALARVILTGRPS